MDRADALTAEPIVESFLSPGIARKKALKGDFEHVALSQLDHLYTSALYLTKEKAEAGDLVQDTSLIDETLKKEE